MSRTRTRLRLWLAASLVLAVGVAGATVTTSAQAAAGCRVTYSITNQWEGGFGAAVTVDNLGDPLTGWQLGWSFTAGQSVTQLWNGTVTQSGAQVTVTNAAYNGSVPSGGSVSFGFNGSGSANPAPASFTLNGVTCTGATTPTTPPVTTPPVTPPPTTPPPDPSAPATFTNPVVWQDFADGDIIRVGDAYYYSASTMHYSPGAPVLRSYDLVNWEYYGHSVPRLDFDSGAYDMSGGRAYVKGIWASAFNYRPANSTYYWLGCTEFNRTYVYTSANAGSGWSKKARINKCYYDAGLLFDNDTPYVAYGNGTISVAQLSSDLTSEVRSQTVYTTPSSIGTLEGARMYKRGSYYYIWLTRPANGQYVLRSTSPFGPYEQRQVLLNLPGPISGGGVPHQGGLVMTQSGQWWYMAFTDAYPGGRMPTLAPITWSNDGWPVLQTVNGRWGASYPRPNLPWHPVAPMTGSDSFTDSTLGPQYEWNHNPDTSKFSVGNGLRLSTATVTNDLYNARNTLTRRIQGPSSTATVQLDYSSMANGDRSGLAMLRDRSAWIGLRKDNGTTRVSMTDGLSMSTSGWSTTGTGSERAGAAVSGGRIWLRVSADIRPGSGRTATFSYSTNGTTFTNLGPAFTLNNDWQFFMGYRFGLFNHATQALGGAVTVNQFAVSTP
ncbi:family 43 glycosylhydrolase [Actinoplanes sp. TRM 88003]|uniref:Family 43 glycosylhydrolase n=1 Tax=Paractinoplanes aksuensis TaxID=2939490 RepID=A0ABT1DL27_9ACTN|nr:family 43 glycosylhydrolase [Actinoplanes aksuensis]MCO8271547.1 family 43 glycosylhydrolase [Actinoplanes aksuensis]